MKVKEKLLEQNVEELKRKFRKIDFKINNGIVNVIEPYDFYFQKAESIKNFLKDNFEMTFSSNELWHIPSYKLMEKLIRFGPRKTIDEMKKELKEIIEKVSHCYRELLIILFDTINPYFYDCPSAYYYHHNYKHGLIEHTIEVVNIAIKMCETTECDRDLVIIGALLHDLGKMHLYKLVDGDRSEMTDFGRSLDHIALSCGFAEVFIDEKYLYENIIHIISSHHGCKEWGSIIAPNTVEAVVVHCADLLSARSYNVLV